MSGGTEKVTYFAGFLHIIPRTVIFLVLNMINIPSGASTDVKLAQGLKIEFIVKRCAGR